MRISIQLKPFSLATLTEIKAALDVLGFRLVAEAYDDETGHTTYIFAE